jgi:predicted component of type VI protein secretion system
VDPQLAAEVRQLHAELQRTSALDGESRQLLESLVQDINGLLKTSTGGSVDPAQRRAVADQLDAAAVRFEVDHPGLSSTMQRVIDVLAKAGF